MTLPEKDQSQGSESSIRGLFIQIGPLSDVFQSLMALRAVKQLYPQLEITFLVRDIHQEVVSRVSWLENVVTLPVDEILSPVLDESKDDSESMKIVAKWLAPLVKENWDYLVNWTYSDSSSFLAGLIPSKNKLGFSRGKEIQLTCTDDWSLYIQGIVQEQVKQNIHLIDIYTTQLLTILQVNEGEPKDVGNEPVTSKTFFDLEVNQDQKVDWNWKFTSRKWLALQIDSRFDGVEFDLENWKQVVSYAIKRHPDYSIVLLGSSARKDTALEIESYIRDKGLDEKRLLSLVGKTDFDLWASVVSQCQWLVSAESPAVHLASVLGTRVVYLASGENSFEEIGPYGNGHYVLQFAKDSKISAESIYGTWSYASSEWTHQRKKSVTHHFSQLGWSEYLKDQVVFRSRIRLGNEGGGVNYQNLIHDGINAEQWTSIVMGQIARTWYCGWAAPIGQELPRDSINSELLRDLRELQDSIGVLERICRKAEFVSRQLDQKAQILRSDRVMKLSDKDELENYSKKLARLDQLIERMGRVHLSLSGFSNMIKVMMHNVPGESLADISKNSISSYHKLVQGISLMRDWLEHTLQLARPKAVALKAVPSPSKDNSPSV